MYEWKIIDDCFVLHIDGEPTSRVVYYGRGAWQTADEDDFHIIDALDPSEAMTYVNNELGIDATFDGDQGLIEIVENMKSSVRNKFDRILEDISDIRDNLTTIYGTRKDIVFSVCQSIIDDELQIAYDTVNSISRRYRITEEKYLNHV